MKSIKTIKIYLAPYVDKEHKEVKNSSGETFVSKRYVTVPSKKNQNIPMVSRKTGKPYLKRSQQYNTWKKIVYPIFEAEKEKLLNQGIDTIYRCHIKTIFYFPDHIARDISNKQESIMDALVDAGIIFDDRVQVCNKPYTEGYICKDRPRTEIYIHILSAEDPEYNVDKTNYERLKQLQLDKRKTIKQWKKQ